MHRLYGFIRSFNRQRRFVMSIKTRKSSAFSFSAKARRHHPSFAKTQLQGWKMKHKEAKLPHAGWDAEEKRVSSSACRAPIVFKTNPFRPSRAVSCAHFAGINTCMKAPYIENVKDVGKFAVAVMGVPFDGGTTYRPGTRFGPQCIRRISALYTLYNYEIGVDLREQMSLCDIGDVFTIPANIEKTFDQISKATAHVFASGAMPIILGGDHSIGFPTVCGIARQTDKKIGIIHFDRHADIQEKDLDERMHTTPWFHATNLPNVPATNLVQIGIGGRQEPRQAVKEARTRDTTIITMNDVEKLGLDKVAEIALEMAWKDCDAVYLSFDIACVDAGFVPGTGWPEPGGFLPREILYLHGLVAKAGICGMEVVEVSPPYDSSDITSLMAMRASGDVLGTVGAHGKMGSQRHIIRGWGA